MQPLSDFYLIPNIQLRRNRCGTSMTKWIRRLALKLLALLRCGSGSIPMRRSCQLFTEVCWFTLKNNQFLQLWKPTAIYKKGCKCPKKKNWLQRTLPHRTPPNLTTPHYTLAKITEHHRTSLHLTTPWRKSPNITKHHYTSLHLGENHRTSSNLTTPHYTSPNRSVGIRGYEHRFRHSKGV